MPRLTILILSFLSVAACGGGGGGGGVASPPQRIDFYVSTTTGSDSNPGTQAQPFETITKALSVARPGTVLNTSDQVHVAAGLYDAVKETFPLVVPEGVNLLKSGNAPPTIVGGSMLDPADAQGMSAAVVLRAYAQLGRFKITNTLWSGDPGIHFGVAVVGEGAHLHLTELSGSRHGGIRVLRGGGTVIAACKIHDHVLGMGIQIAGGGVGGSIYACDIYANRIGIEYDSQGPALNGLDLDYRVNEIHDNTKNDLWVAPGIFVDARYNAWDHFGPTFTADPNTGTGIDIFHFDLVLGVDTAGATLYTP